MRERRQEGARRAVADDNHLAAFFPGTVSASDDIRRAEDHTGADFTFAVLGLLLKVDCRLVLKATLISK